MRLVPDGTHRERGDKKKPAEWYIIWLGVPHAEGSVIIGRSRRLRREKWHRFFPEQGGASSDIKGWVNGVDWLLKQYDGRRDTP